MFKKIGKFALDIAKARGEEAIRRSLLYADAVPLADDNALDLKAGDLVRERLSFGMIVKPKTRAAEGILAVLRAEARDWYHKFEYCPYSRTVSADGGCQIKTGAYDRSDGRANTALVFKLEHELLAEERGLGGCPAPSHRFPAFDFVEGISRRAYVPAIEELRDAWQNSEMGTRLLRLIERCGTEPLPVEDGIRIWSSTDNRDCSSFDEALLLDVGPNGAPAVRSAKKQEKAFVIPFKRF